MKHIMKFKLDKETKNTIRYAADSDDEPAAITTIYMQKWAVKDRPKEITVTVEAG